MNNNYQNINYPIETINYPLKAKCFTSFSSINFEENVKFHLDKIIMGIRPNMSLIPPQSIDKYYIALHSPNIIPEFKLGTNFLEVKPGVKSTILFNKMNVDRNYESNCKNYDHSNSLRSDCLAVCLMKKIQTMNGHILMNQLLVRKENFHQSHRLNISNSNHYISNWLIEFSQYCEEQCKPDCQFSYYFYDISQHTDSQLNLKQAHITIQHNRLPDVYLRHLLETTFISFISNFGGLLGMWLGISASTIFKNLLLISNIIIKYFLRPRQLFIRQNYLNSNRHYHLNAQININLPQN